MFSNSKVLRGSKKLPIETIVKQTIKKKENVKLMKLGVFRTAKGIEVYVESEFIETFFRKYNISEGELMWGSSKPYTIPAGLSSNFRYMLESWKGGLFLESEQSTPNLSMIRAEGISEGKRFLFNSQIYSKAELTKFGKMFKEQVLKFFDEYLKPVNVSIEMVFSIKEDD